MAKSTKRIAVIVTTSVAAVTVAGVAFAAWTSTGTGKAAVAAGTLAKVTVNEATIVGELRPGATADLHLKVTNPADNGQVKITKVALTDAGIRANATAESNGCVGPDTGVLFHPDALSENTVIDEGSEEEIVLAEAVEMTNDSVDGCQGATFSVPVVVTAETTGEAAAA